MLTDRDIVVRAVADGADPKSVKVGEAMTPDPATCRPDCPIDDDETMRDKQIRRLVVTQEHNRNVLGIISLGDIAARGHERELVGAATEEALRRAKVSRSCAATSPPDRGRRSTPRLPDSLDATPILSPRARKSS